jgi:hypothetical protein
MRAQASTSATGGTRLVVLIASSGDARAVLWAAANASMIGPGSAVGGDAATGAYVWFGTSEWVSPSLLDVDAVCGAACLSAMRDVALPGVFGTMSPPPNATWAAVEWAPAFPAYAGGAMDPTVPFAYDAVAVLVAALRRVCGGAAAGCAANWSHGAAVMAATRAVSLPGGASGPVSFDAAGGRVGALPVLANFGAAADLAPLGSRGAGVYWPGGGAQPVWHARCG